MKLSINCNGSLALDFVTMRIRSNPRRSYIAFEINDNSIQFSCLQEDRYCEFTFSVVTMTALKDFNLIFNYPLTKYNPFIFPWLTFYSFIIN